LKHADPAQLGQPPVSERQPAIPMRLSFHNRGSSSRILKTASSFLEETFYRVFNCSCSTLKLNETICVEVTQQTKNALRDTEG
jgi:hypothetical protein